MKKSTWAAVIAAAAIVIGGGVWAYQTYFNNEYFKSTKITEAKISMISAPRAYYTVDGKPVADSVDVFFDHNVAAPYAYGKKGLVGFKMVPETAGSWRFSAGAQLVFKPQENWIPAQEYEVTMPEDIFAEGIKVKERTFKFRAPEFEARRTAKDFYEDPRDVGKKSVTASFEFTYPVKEESIKDGVEIKTIHGKEYGFTYTLKNGGTMLHVISEPVKLGVNDDFAIISVNKVKNIYNNTPIANADKPVALARVTIPSISTFFKVKDISASLIRNEGNEPEQVVGVAFSAALDDESLKDRVTVAYCKENCYGVFRDSNTEKARWVKLDVEALPAQEGLNTRFFRYHLPKRNAALRVLLKEGVTSKEGYPLASVRQVIRSADYPREANISFDGAVIPLQTQRSVAFSSRGVPALQVKIAKIAEDDLNHLVTQTGGDFATPYFKNYSFSEENIATIFEKELMINNDDVSELKYSSLDLTPYLDGKSGVFLITLQGKDGNNTVTPADTRLIMVTDLGVIVKDNADGSHNLFVANISKGEAAEGAKVEVLGVNGQPVLSAVTDNQGMAALPSFAEFKNDKSAVAYKISLNGDMSFIPVWKNDRILDYSRYNVGGEYTSSKQDKLKAFLFTDRGIYRPNETAHFGIMTRLENLKPAEGLPLIAKIRTADWKLVSQKSFVSAAGGLDMISYTLPAAAPLGRYSLTLYKNTGNYEEYVDSIDFDVEEFLPDTMKLSLAFEPRGGKGWNTANNIVLKADLANLYGTAADGHGVKGYYRMVPARFQFGEYMGYQFYDPSAVSDGQRLTIEEELTPQQTDKDGVAQFDINLNRHYRGTYRLTAVMTGLEREGGRGVEQIISGLFSPNSYLLGYKADTQNNALSFLAQNSAHKIHLIAIDSNLQQIAAEDLVLKVYTNNETRVLTLLDNGTYGYQRTVRKVPVKAESFNITREGYDVVLDTATAGDYVLAVEEKGGKELLSLNYSVAGAANENFKEDKLQNLSLSLDKKEYTNGETIRVQIRAPFKGMGLLSIEQDKVYAYKWFKTDSKASVQEIQLPDGVAGNAYLNVAIARDITAEEIFDKPLSYGIAPFNISVAAYNLPIELSVPESVKPGEELKIGYKTPEDADIFLWGVNTGILQVSDYKLPSPLEFFIPKKALQVATRQILDLVLPDTKLALQLAAAGGGADAEDDEVLLKMLNPFARKQNKPAAFWSGLLKSRPEEQFFSYTVPDTFNGEMKIMAAGMNAGKFGAVEKSVLVRGDFALTLTGPLYAAPDDVFEAGAAVSNLIKGSGTAYKVRLSVLATDGLEILGENSRILEIDENGESSVSFKLKALNKLGAQTITFTAEAVDSPEQHTSMALETGIRPAVPFVTDVTAGKAARQVTLKNFVKEFYPYQRSQKVYASASPLILAKGLLQYLGKYPHYCTEQSVSKIFPAMVLLFKLPAEDAAAYINSKFVYDTYDDVLAKLIDRQKADGGFAMWGGTSLQSDKFVSVYALEFLTAAKKYGFNVPKGVYDGAIRFAKTVAAEEPDDENDTLAAYAAYVLTEAGEVTTNYLLNLENVLQRDCGDKWKSTLNGVYIAAGYQLLHNPKKALPLIKRYKFGWSDLSNARYIYIASKVFGGQNILNSVQDVEKLLQPLEKQDFNTISSAFAILALSEIGQNEAADDIRFDGATAEQNGLYGAAEVTPAVMELKLAADKPFFYTVEQEGFAVNLPEKAVANGLQMAKKLKAPKGKTLNTLELGDEVTVEITVKNTCREYISNVALTDLLAGGVEIIRGSIESNDYLSHSEAREDRMLAYFDMGMRDTITVTYKVRVTAQGDFVVPAAYANAMYDPKISANTLPDRLVIE